MVADTPPPIPVGLNRHQWSPVNSSESGWSVVVIVVVAVVDGVGIGNHGQNSKGSGVGLGRY